VKFVRKTGQLKITRAHMMLPQQHLYNGLARPADYSVSSRKWTRQHSHHGWRGWRVRASRRCHGTNTETAGHTR